MHHEPLPTINLEQANQLSFPDEMPELVHLDDTALCVLVDFNHQRPLTIKAGEFVDKALEEMKTHNVHLLIVTDDEGHVAGLISSEDLIGDKLMRIMQERGMPRNEIRVRLLMSPQQELSTLNIAELHHAKVGNIIQTLHQLKTRYLLVTETFDESGHQQVIGLFAASQISKQIHKDITDSLGEVLPAVDLEE